MNTIQRFQSHFPHGMDAVLIRSHPNRYYFTGLSSMGGTLLITPDSARFVIDSRYFEIASQAVSGCEVVLETNLAEQLGEWIRGIISASLGRKRDTSAFWNFSS